ncbi:MAG TPA: hypothetical protein O0X37_04860 [Methanocorpusculum sp.]|nr:hypothetical protein [Methanocorpusculum sp.]
MQIEYLSPGHALITDAGVSVDAYCLELGSANLIFVKTSSGIVGCGFLISPLFKNSAFLPQKLLGSRPLRIFLRDLFPQLPLQQFSGG